MESFVAEFFEKVNQLRLCLEVRDEVQIGSRPSQAIGVKAKCPDDCILVSLALKKIRDYAEHFRKIHATSNIASPACHPYVNSTSSQ